jgi:hypothetical protein
VSAELAEKAKKLWSDEGRHSAILPCARPLVNRVGQWRVAQWRTPSAAAMTAVVLVSPIGA